MAPHFAVQQLACFVAVAEEEQFTRAADRLGVAQPSVSFHIHRMELAVGAPLFHRGRGPVSLTDVGVALLPLARRVLADLDEMEYSAQEHLGLVRGKVSIGATPSLAASLLPAVLARFHDRSPRIALEVMERDATQLVEGLETGTLDLAVAVLPLHHDLLEQEVVAVEELVVVVAPGSELAKRSEVGITDLAGVPLIMFHRGYDLRTITYDAFRAADVTPTVVLDGAEIGSVLAMVAQGIGAAIVPSIVAIGSRRVQAIRCTQPRLERSIGIVRRRDRELSTAASSLRVELLEYVASMGWPGDSAPGLRLIER